MASANTAPFIYNGDGSVSEMPGFHLGTDCYSPVDGKMKYMDIKTGIVKETSLQDAAQNVSNEVGLLGKYKFSDGTNLKFSAKYSNSDAAIVFQPGLSIKKVSAADGYTYSDTHEAYSGYVQNRMSMIDFGKVHDAMMMAELNKQVKNHALRLGMNEWFNSIEYVGNSTRYQHELAPNPRKLDNNGVTYSSYNTSGEYYKGTENRVAAYLTDDWNISKKLNAYIGARLEYFTLNGDNLPYKRYSNFHLGSTNPANGDVATLKGINHTWLLPALTANVTYKMTRQFGFLAEASYSEQGAKLSDYAGNASPYTDAVTVPYGRAGVYYNNPVISLVSAVNLYQENKFPESF